ncbi:putative ribosome biogenesis protein Slx9 [Helianthus annuus]|uniref:Ribosome biogenesis protein Slx9 n=1 Tax=Helianthus annuus TaxID=4232 RepID=A0A251RZC4_HELAN|nr:putative ribosome biogenesis protein slx9-like [Helianthus annuus]XP_022017884.1 putative ribosome biogenesis protein slx9-like [Helianthus annuus]KAF5760342.1 putative ribosome biogenesis protein Slx9 [Helianthus annuus]KAJ0438404.1 putative ribosome biogenesis protein Slx9 [Helianthus annuus]KAJ0443147.1 putative ribosome biogenesis protein Slx9 [Helianthus annuus]KAJ0460729.1 putative ribosome biogenesis protein Slx9 [Helianthus annuus]KAJ0645061.1 putative ribosome biogenesis protein S
MGKTSSRKDKPKHADQKFEKKLEFYSKVRETVALGAQKAIKKKKRIRTRQKKLKAYNLSSLAECLPDLESSKRETPADFKVTTKSKQKLVMKETNQLKTVLNNPTFQADPLAALHQHLQNTQPVCEKPARKSVTGKKKKNKKKKGSKASTGSQSMEE